MKDLEGLFGSDVFSKKVMKAMLSDDVYKRLEKTIKFFSIIDCLF